MPRKVTISLASSAVVLAGLLIVNIGFFGNAEYVGKTQDSEGAHNDSEWRSANRSSHRGTDGTRLTAKQAYDALRLLAKNALIKAGNISVSSNVRKLVEVHPGGFNSNNFVSQSSHHNILPLPDDSDDISFVERDEEQREREMAEINKLVKLLNTHRARSLVLEFYRENQSSGLFESAPWEVSYIVQKSISLLVAKKPEHTISWLTRNGVVISDRRVLHAIADGWASVDPVRALRYIDTLEPESEEEMDALLWRLWLPDFSARKLTYQHFARQDYMGALRSAFGEKNFSRKSTAVFGVISGLPANSDFPKVAHELAFFALPDDPDHKETGIRVMNQMNDQFALQWLDQSPDDAMKWYAGIQQKKSGRWDGKHPRNILYYWAEKSPQRMFAWANGIKDPDMKKYAVRALGNSRYDMALKLVQTEDDPETRIKLAKYATMRPELFDHSDVPQVPDIPIIGRLFGPFDSSRSDEFIEIARASGLSEAEKEAVVSWIEEMKVKKSKPTANASK